MNMLMKLAYIGLSSMALLASTGCLEANAFNGAEPRVVASAIARVQMQPSADAAQDDGPGCAESLLDSATLK